MKISVVIYAIAIPLAFVHSLVAASFYILVALIWPVPDKRFEKLFLNALESFSDYSRLNAIGLLPIGSI